MASWRAFATEHRTRVSVGFIDGDLVERFLDLPRDKMELVVKNMKVNLLLCKSFDNDYLVVANTTRS